MILAPSLLSANFGSLDKDIDMINNSMADWFHIDVMDGVFVPNISFGQPIIKYIGKLAKKPLDVHLMIVDPDRYFNDFKSLGADIITVHYEACTHLHRSISSIKALGMKAGVVLNPHTPIEMIQHVLKDVDFVLLMTVNPGFGGQKFIDNVVPKIEALSKMIKEMDLNVEIEIDGGITSETIVPCAKAGATIFEAGSAIYNKEDRKAALQAIKTSGEAAIGQ